MAGDNSVRNSSVKYYDALILRRNAKAAKQKTLARAKAAKAAATNAAVLEVLHEKLELEEASARRRALDRSYDCTWPAM